MKSVTRMVAGVGLLVSTMVLSAARGENEGKFPFTGIVTGNSVNVRSGPDSNYPPLSKLMRNNKVEVVGEEDTWYKIVPPEGSFSWVSKDFVEKKEGSKGVVTGDRVQIRAGSSLNDRKVPQLPANKGMEVTILGEAGNWYKIVPPEGVFVWVAKSFVKPLASDKSPSAPAGTTTKPTGEKSPAKTVTEESTTEITKTTLKEVTTRPTNPPAIPGVNKGVFEKHYSYKITTTLPAGEAELLGKYTKQIEEMDREFLREMKKPLPERKFDKVEAGFKEIADQKENKAAAQFAKDRLAMIEYQKNAQQGIDSIQELSDNFTLEMSKSVVPAMRETEINPETYRLQGSGVLRPSLVFEGPLMPKRFRLFDPDKGRTIAYVELAPNVEINVSQYLSKNVAVYGTSTFDAKLGFKLIKADALRILEDTSKITNSSAVIP